MSDEADETLVERAKRGDAEAYAELIRRYRERIYVVIFGFTHNHNDTDDLAQETFWRAFRKLRHFRRKSKFYTWIFRIAVNLSLNFLKKRKEEMGREEWADTLAARRDAAFSHPESAAERKELRERLSEAIDSLPLSYRASFNLVAVQGMSHRQAARILRCSENTVSWRMHKARKMLQDRMRPYLEEVTDEMHKN